MKIQVDGIFDTDKLTDEQKEQILQEWNKPKEWPQYGDIYYYVDSAGFVCKDKWSDHPIDHLRLSVGNRFRTEKEAKYKHERDKVLKELEGLADGKLGTKHYVMRLYLNDIESIDCVNLIYSKYRFATVESCQHAIDTIGKERLKKYYFGVKDDV